MNIRPKATRSPRAKGLQPGKNQAEVLLSSRIRLVGPVLVVLVLAFQTYSALWNHTETPTLLLWSSTTTPEGGRSVQSAEVGNYGEDQLSTAEPDKQADRLTSVSLREDEDQDQDQDEDHSEQASDTSTTNSSSVQHRWKKIAETTKLRWASSATPRTKHRRPMMMGLPRRMWGHGMYIEPGAGLGYRETGGLLPDDMNFVFPDPQTWPAIDNGTCLTEGREDHRPMYSWQLQAPVGILLGCMKAGTQALMRYLFDHPSIVRKNRGIELHFFNSKQFVRNETGIPRITNQKLYALRISKHFSDLFYRENGFRKAYPEKFVIDDTPYYFLAADRMPEAIMCVAPWTKWMVVLRHPVARADSQYRYLNQFRKNKHDAAMVDWDRWVSHDIGLLKSTGVVQDWTKVDFDTFSGSLEEGEAWKRYIRSRNSRQIVGRGLYAIQLDLYYKAMDRGGKPRSDLLVIDSDELRYKTQETYDSVLRHLGMPEHKLENTELRHTTKEKSREMPEHVRQKLHDLYEPYNKRLFKMLGWEYMWGMEQRLNITE